MKKIRILSLTLIVAAMLMGAGYAAWTDTLTINNTVKTGDLDIKFVQSNLDLMHPNACGDKFVAATTSIDDTAGHTMTVTMNNLYPGCSAYFRLKGINAGTIPAKLDNINITFSGEQALSSYLTYKTNIAICPDGETTTVHYFPLSGTLETFAGDFNKYLNDNKDLQGMQLQPNNIGCFYIGASNNGSANNLNSNINPDEYIVIKLADNTPPELQSKTLTFTLTINFKQFNL